MNEELIEYRKLYDSFVAGYRKGHVGPEDVGIKILELGREKVRLNLLSIEIRKAYRARKAGFAQGEDKATGKPMSSAKADVLADDTPEAAALDEIDVHVENCRDCLYYLHDLKDALSLEAKMA